MTCETLVERLRKRAAIRRQISSRKSVQEGKPDRLADLLEEAATELENLETIDKQWEEFVTQDDNEYARYLATYLIQHSDSFVFTSFDRNGSHNADEYKEYTYLDEKSLYECIKRFATELP